MYIAVLRYHGYRVMFFEGVLFIISLFPMTRGVVRGSSLTEARWKERAGCDQEQVGVPVREVLTLKPSMIVLNGSKDVVDAADMTIGPN